MTTNRVCSLVFDFDGLILDTESPIYTAICEVLATLGLEYPLEQALKAVGTVPATDWIHWAENELGRPFSEHDRAALRHRSHARHTSLIESQEVLPGVVALLHEAAERGVACAVASSSPETWVEGHLRLLGLRHHFQVVRCRDHVAAPKPAPDLYLAAVAALDRDPSSAVAFEDSHHGSIAAKAAALACVACPGPLTTSQDFSHVDLQVASLADLTWGDLERLID